MDEIQETKKPAARRGRRVEAGAVAPEATSAAAPASSDNADAPKKNTRTRVAKPATDAAAAEKPAREPKA
ncbi:MAG: hypothetical protein ACKOWI_06995, partial [Rhodoluna sp.]